MKNGGKNKSVAFIILVSQRIDGHFQLELTCLTDPFQLIPVVL